MEWQSIETAPKDGEEIMICTLYDDGTCSHFEIVRWPDFTDHWIGLQDICLSDPTHWMPLPEPPEA